MINTHTTFSITLLGLQLHFIYIIATHIIGLQLAFISNNNVINSKEYNNLCDSDFTRIYITMK